MTSQRHHRDLFTGSVGLPNVGTHVGSVVHAFETMAMNQQQVAEVPQSRLVPGPIKLSGGGELLNNNLSAEKKFYKFPTRRGGVESSSSPVRKITLATDPKLENPMANVGLLRFEQDVSPNQSDFDATLRGDYRKHFQDTNAATLTMEREGESVEEKDHLLRGTMVSRSFIKNVRKPRKVGNDETGAIELTTKRKTKTSLKSQIVTQQKGKAPLAPPVGVGAAGSSRTPQNMIFRPKAGDKAML